MVIMDNLYLRIGKTVEWISGSSLSFGVFKERIRVVGGVPTRNPRGMPGAYGHDYAINKYEKHGIFVEENK